MNWPKLRWGWLELLTIPIGAFAILLFVISAPAAWEDGGGWIAVASVGFAYILLFLGLHGLFVMWSVRKRDRGNFRVLLIFIILASLAMAALSLVVVLLGFGDVVLDNGLEVQSVPGALLVFVVLFLVFLIMGMLLAAVACSAMWFFSKVMLRTIPGFLDGIRRVRFSPDDRWSDRLKAWSVDLPPVLDPSLLSLNFVPLQETRARRRFMQAVFWQLVIGLLIVVYVSLNPLLLQTMSFSQTFFLATISSLAIPMMVLPWSMLEALGAKVPGPRVDFLLSEGAQKRLIQTMIALGTLVLIIRLAIEEIGAESIASRFVGYFVGLALISLLFSFVYFRFFEANLIADLHQGLQYRGF